MGKNRQTNQKKLQYRVCREASPHLHPCCLPSCTYPGIGTFFVHASNLHSQFGSWGPLTELQAIGWELLTLSTSGFPCLSSAYYTRLSSLPMSNMTYMEIGPWLSDKIMLGALSRTLH